ncbi:MAG TPA: dihydrofolate reductase family protein [Candidatus Cybelea sp.]|nr:dihydrofolate reductase family protein [Candidatus Cybelea sp.]
MRTVTYGGAVSLDGFLAGPDGSIDWLHFSKDVQEVMARYWKDVDTILMGRKTYAFVVSSGRGASTGKKRTRDKAPKEPAVRTYVFSRTLPSVDEPGVELVKEDAVEFVRGLKHRPGKEICLMGGGELAQSLLTAGLVDRIGLNIHPILLGSGIPTFRDPGQRVKLTLEECRPLEGGCVLVNYSVLSAESSHSV